MAASFGVPERTPKDTADCHATTQSSLASDPNPEIPDAGKLSVHAASAHNDRADHAESLSYSHAPHQLSPTRTKSSIHQRTSSTSASASSSPAASHTVHDAVRPQLSERDSIFATSYLPSINSAVSSTPSIRGAKDHIHEGRDAEWEGNAGRLDTMAAASPLHNNHFYSAPALNTDVHRSAMSLQFQHNLPRRPRPSKTQQYQRRSLYDLYDLSPLPISDLLQQIHSHDPTLPDTPLRKDHQSPATHSPTVDAIDYAQKFDQNAERQQYRSWRKGQAKMIGMTIKESQRKPGKANDSVDKVIDAQLPQPDPPVANARSRKASHYLGLFRENEAEEKRENEKRKAERSKDTQEHRPRSSKEPGQREESNNVREDPIVENIESMEDDADVIDSLEQTLPKLPLDLLDEIKNREQLVSKSGRKTQYVKHMSDQMVEPLGMGTQGQILKSDDDESDREHISSATYFPHPGTLADSPTDEQLTQHKPQDSNTDQRSEGLLPNDVRVSLHSEDARDYLQGISRGPSTANFQHLRLPEPAIPDPTESESEYESDAYAYDSTMSADDEDPAETTPTATPRVKARRQSSHGKPSRPAPVNSVELKPFKHQVGGHTPVYRFSRRAVCKQLNSKENMFYETVEQHHPELLGYMPRYIGVLNVTYRKEPKKRKHTPSDELKTQDADEMNPKQLGNEETDKKTENDQARLISHSMQIPNDVPQVIFENNRHLIPEHLFNVPPRSRTPDHPRTAASPPKRENQSDDEASNGASRRPSLKPASSWGFTLRNEKLRDHVLREVFAPPVIHRHDRRDRSYHPRAAGRPAKLVKGEITQNRQNSVDISSLQRFRTSPNGESANGSYQRHVQQTYSEMSGVADSDFEQLLLDKKHLSKSVEPLEPDITAPNIRSHHRRRHSGGGLTRKKTDIESLPGELEFHEDDAYTADVEEYVFAMDDVKREAASKRDSGHDGTAGDGHAKADTRTVISSSSSPNLPILGPRNPETSLVQQDERVERFLLLEDLTSGMHKPCVLDLKMGTRQYGIEAGEKKQASQRMKCKTTTSRELGVRVCGMQVFNVKEQKYAFEDKYFGRDLTAGREFRAALKRFFWDGIGYAQAEKHIPSVLDKINQLDSIIRGLPGYRLYASSLLLIYDRGDADDQGKVRRHSDGRLIQHQDIKLKIVDFANCVTAEDMERVLKKPCPPSSPNSIDRGYVRGLRTLKSYFQQIYSECRNQRYAVERGEGEGMAIDQRGISGATTGKGWTDSVIDDPGEVSV